MQSIMKTEPNPALTMTSLEISKLTGKRHDNVKRAIENLSEDGTIQLPQIEEVKNHLGQTVTVYRIKERDSYIVVAQLSPKFTARLVDRWVELETKQAKLQAPTATKPLLLGSSISPDTAPYKALFKAVLAHVKVGVLGAITGRNKVTLMAEWEEEKVYWPAGTTFEQTQMIWLEFIVRNISQFIKMDAKQ